MIQGNTQSRTSVQSIVHRPILFSGPMVRAILGGRKTQTRREVKLDKAYHECGRHEIIEWREQNDKWFGLYEWNTVASLQCPYGRIGDRLWVRETAKATATEEGIDCIHYMADDHCRSIMVSEYGLWRKMRAYGGGHARAVPSIHMPRWASRITLEITGLRIERLNAITPDDAKAEGVECFEKFQKAKRGHPLNAHWVGFAWLWKSINGEQSWLANPWVWVVEFKVV
jgi:hypothetical protein